MIKNIFITLCSLLTCSAGFAQKPSDTPSNQMEKLDRGLIVVPMSNKHYVGVCSALTTRAQPLRS